MAPGLEAGAVASSGQGPSPDRPADPRLWRSARRARTQSDHGRICGLGDRGRVGGGHPRQLRPARLGWRRGRAGRVCVGVRLPSASAGSADVLAGLDLLHAQARVDPPPPARIASWSHGGWAVGDLVTLRDPGDGSFKSTMADVEAIRFTYPYCAFPAQGGKRDWTWKGGGVSFDVLPDGTLYSRPPKCRPLMTHARSRSAPRDRDLMTAFPALTHAFDGRVESKDSKFYHSTLTTLAVGPHADFITWLKTPAPGR